MSIAAIGAGISALFGIINQVATPPAAAAAPDPAAQLEQAKQARLASLAQMRGKIQNAVITALKDPANAAADPNQVIQKAIAGVLQGDDLTAATDTDPQAQNAEFDSLLKAHGVDVSQFHADFQAALVDAKASGKLDSAMLFQSFPPGSGVNVVG